MNVNGKYLKDETGKVISPITSVDTIFKNNTKLLDLIYPVGSYYEQVMVLLTQITNGVKFGKKILLD